MLGGAIIGELGGNYTGQVLGEALAGQGPGLTRDVLSTAGGVLGAAGGMAFPFFKHGGVVPGKKGRAKKIIAHSGEYVLPIGVRPTQAQRKAVAKRKAAAAKPKAKAAPKKKARSRK